MTGSGIPTIPIGVYFDKEARRLQKCIMRYFGKTDFHRCSMLHRQEEINSECDMRGARLELGGSGPLVLAFYCLVGTFVGGGGSGGFWADGVAGGVRESCVCLARCDG